MFIEKLPKSMRYRVLPAVRFMRNWGRPLATYSLGACILAIYFIDWRVVVTKVPFYRKKFTEPRIE